VPALKSQEHVIAAGRAIRILPAYARPRVVDRAAALVLIKKSAGGFEYMVLLVTQHRRLAFDDLDEFFPGRLNRQIEMLRQAGNVGFIDLDVVVAAAISRAFGAVVLDFLLGCAQIDFLRLAYTNNGNVQ
jgi:hypothetical protein